MFKGEWHRDNHMPYYACVGLAYMLRRLDVIDGDSRQSVKCIAHDWFPVYFGG